jgi:hypothetical protein
MTELAGVMLTLCTFIGEVPGLNFGRDAGCPDFFSVFFSFPQANVRILPRSGHDSFLLKPFQFNTPLDTIQGIPGGKANIWEVIVSIILSKT